MFLSRLLICSILLLLPNFAAAQEEVELDSGVNNNLNVDSASTNDTNNQKTPENSSINITVMDQISSVIGNYATHNITDAEKVFCYQIATPPENYTGYTVDGMAIVGFCGVIKGKLLQLIGKELFNESQNIIFNQVENCTIKPQIMLRFIRGIDSTDVLVSSPCHALAFFYGGKVTAFNAKPASAFIDNLIRPLINNKVDFVSPSLLNQLLPVGVVKTEEQKALLKQKNEPFLRWKQDKQQKAAKSAGWNKLKSPNQED